MYRKIVNPETGRKVNINGIIGKRVLRNYINLIGGSDNQPENEDEEIFNPWGSDESASDDDVHNAEEDQDNEGFNNMAAFMASLNDRARIERETRIQNALNGVNAAMESNNLQELRLAVNRALAYGVPETDLTNAIEQITILEEAAQQ